MKKGFTLVELLVVVVVIVTLLGVTFRLAGVGSDSTARNVTVNRLQRLENCLSGYYAAYGSYPPVKLHASRNYKLEADEHGLQKESEWAGTIKNGDDSAANMSGTTVGRSIDAACKAQPIGMSYPFNEDYLKDVVSGMSVMLMQEHPGDSQFNFQALIEPSIIGNDRRQLTDWQDTQVFRFGVLSYLLPRYLIIMGGDTDNEEFFTKFEQWKANNQLPPRFKDGVPFNNWGEVNAALRSNGAGGAIEPWMIAALPSQATCARWLPNLEKQLCTPKPTADRTYGVELQSDSQAGYTPLMVYPADGTAGSSSQQFIPDRITALDGWGNEYYYYSVPPHQSYRLWSAGKNGKTFPPWLTDEELGQLSGEDRTVVQKWIADDIVQMSN